MRPATRSAQGGTKSSAASPLLDRDRLLLVPALVQPLADVQG